MDKHDVPNISRVLHNAWARGEKIVQGLVTGRAWGTWKPVGGGSYETALLTSTDHDSMKDKNSQAYCVHASLYAMQGQAFMIESDRPCPS